MKKNPPEKITTVSYSCMFYVFFMKEDSEFEAKNE
jgi:hypothetical protein